MNIKKKKKPKKRIVEIYNHLKDVELKNQKLFMDKDFELKNQKLIMRK